MHRDQMTDELAIVPCSLIYPYFDNPAMLEHQVEVWNRYGGELGKRLQFVLVDDCSSQPAEPIFSKLKHRKILIRIKERLPWNQHQARNIGAYVANPLKDGSNPWLFLSDIDIVLTPEAAYTMLARQLDPHHHYTVERTFAPDFEVRKVHPNTFLVTKRAYWTINGYDLDLTGGYGGGYGGDGEFARQLSAICPRKHLDDVVTIGYGRRERNGQPSVIADADTQSLDRDEWQKKYRAAFDRKRRTGDMRSRDPIRVEFERIL
jgi:hypothetical protein